LKTKIIIIGFIAAAVLAVAIAITVTGGRNKQDDSQRFVITAAPLNTVQTSATEPANETTIRQETTAEIPQNNTEIPPAPSDEVKLPNYTGLTLDERVITDSIGTVACSHAKLIYGEKYLAGFYIDLIPNEHLKIGYGTGENTAMGEGESNNIVISLRDETYGEVQFCTEQGGVYSGELPAVSDSTAAGENGSDGFYKGQYANNERNGLGILISDNTYIGEWTDNKQNGYGLLLKSSGEAVFVKADRGEINEIVRVDERGIVGGELEIG
jgi:hypothetical protein